MKPALHKGHHAEKEEFLFFFLITTQEGVQATLAQLQSQKERQELKTRYAPFFVSFPARAQPVTIIVTY